MGKINLAILLCFSLTLLTGCWDTVSIEERGFIIGTAFDYSENEQDNLSQVSVTNQMVLPAGIPSVSKGDGEPFTNFTASSDSIYKVDEEIVSRSSKQPYYEHLTILIISEKIAKQENLFKHILDTYIRDVDFRRGINVIVSKGEAKALLDFKTPDDNLPALHINRVLEHASKQVGSITPKTIGDLEELHLTEHSYVLPYFEVSNLVEQKQGAVFHGRENKMVGLLNPKEMQGLEMIIGNQQVKIISFSYEEQPMAFKVIRLFSKLTVDPSNLEDIKVKLEIELEGTIKESFSQKDLSTSASIKDVQNKLAKEVKDSIEQAIQKAQGEFGTDVFNIWKEIESKHYDTWIKIKPDWEQGEYYFKNVSFDIDIIPQIYSIGTTKKTS